MLKKVGDISYHESCFNENSEKFESLALDCSGGSEIMQFKIRKMNNIAHEDLQVTYFNFKDRFIKEMPNKFYSLEISHFRVILWSNLGYCWIARAG